MKGQTIRFKKGPGHHYYLNGNEIPSVTQLMGALLPDGYFEHASTEKGSLLHEAFSFLFLRQDRVKAERDYASSIPWEEIHLDWAIEKARLIEDAIIEQFGEIKREDFMIETPGYSSICGGIGYTPDLFDPKRGLLIELKSSDRYCTVAGHTWGDVQTQIYKMFLETTYNRDFESWIFSLDNGHVKRRKVRLVEGTGTMGLVQALAVCYYNRFIK